MQRFNNKLEIIRPHIFDGEEGIQAWFTLKNSGSASDAEISGLDLGSNTSSTGRKVVENRDRLFRELDLEPDWVAFGSQVHGTRVRYVTAGGTYPETDALITDVPGLALAIQVADCAAVLLADPKRRLVGAVHAGWRGAAGEILPRTIALMKDRGSNPGELKSYVSPCITRQNFEVGEEVAEQFPERYVDREQYDKPHVDLKEYLRHQMLHEGMKEDLIEIDDGCTVGEPGRFFSYRREQEKSGRMLGIIMLGT